MKDEIQQDTQNCQIDADTLSTTFIFDVNEAKAYFELSLTQQKQNIDERIEQMKQEKLTSLNDKLSVTLAAYDPERVEAETRIQTAREVA